MAAREIRAAVSRAAVARGGDALAQGMAIGQFDQFRQVPIGCGLGPGCHPSGQSAFHGRLQGQLRWQAPETLQAQIVGAPLEQRHRGRATQCCGQSWQVTMKQLVLQGPGSGGDDDAPARQQCRHQIREGLADAGTRLGHQPATLFKATGHVIGQLLLSGPRPKTRHGARQGSFLTQNFVQFLRHREAQSTEGHPDVNRRKCP
jgi:hypothetical protein